MFDDNFVLVTNRRKQRGFSKRSSFHSTSGKVQGEDNIEVNLAVVLRKIHEAKEILASSIFFESVESALENALQICNAQSLLDIICYGLGHFTECKIARYQLALLCLLQEKFSSVVFIHDPLFYSCEVDILKELNFSVIEENEEGKRLARHGKSTLLYTLHCPQQLTNNFLWTNWGLSLKDCIIFGNSFTDLIERNISSNSSSVSFIQKIQPYTDELTIANTFVYTDIFNNTSLHVFPIDKLHILESRFWTEDCQEPVYPDNDTEFIERRK